MDEDEIERLLREAGLDDLEQDPFGDAVPPSLDDLGGMGDKWELDE